MVMFDCSKPEAEKMAKEKLQGQSADNAEQSAKAALEGQWEAKQRLLEQKYPKMEWSPANKASSKAKFLLRAEEEKAELML